MGKTGERCVSDLPVKTELAVILLLLAPASSLLPYAATPHSAGLVRDEGSIDTMGTLFAIVAYGKSHESVRAAISNALDEAARVDRLLSNYQPDSEWSRVNRLAAEQAVPVSPELFDLLAACKRYNEKSEGTFDISVGPLMKLWGFYQHSGHLPDAPKRARHSPGTTRHLKRPVASAERKAPSGIPKTNMNSYVSADQPSAASTR